MTWTPRRGRRDRRVGRRGAGRPGRRRAGGRRTGPRHRGRAARRRPLAPAGYPPPPLPQAPPPAPVDFSQVIHSRQPRSPSRSPHAPWVHDTQQHNPAVRRRRAAPGQPRRSRRRLSGALDARVPPAAGTDRLAHVPARGHPRPARVRPGAQHRGGRHRAADRPASGSPSAMTCRIRGIRRWPPRWPGTRSACSPHRASPPRSRSVTARTRRSRRSPPRCANARPSPVSR